MEVRRFSSNSTETEIREWVESLKKKETGTTLRIMIDGTPLDVAWEDNESVQELRNLVENGQLVVSMVSYVEFEQVGTLEKDLPRDDVQRTSKPGDIFLYEGNKFVFFYGNNSWSYTKLGCILGMSDEEIKELLDKDSVKLTLWFE